MEGSEKNGNLVFAVNGERFELSCIDPSTTLLQFLRYYASFKSPKLGCGEGKFSFPLHSLLFCYSIIFDTCFEVRLIKTRIRIREV